MMFYIVYKVFMENAAGVLGESDPQMEQRISQIVLRHDDIKDIQKLIVLKEGDALHVEVVAEIAPDLTVKYTNELRDDIEALILKQNHIGDVNIEFEVDNGHRSWPETQVQLDNTTGKK